MNYLKTLLLLGVSICGLSLVHAEPSQSPLRGRVNHNVIKRIVALRDQEIFNVFKNQAIDNDKVDMENFEQIVFSLKPAEGINFDDFDFDLKISKEYFGAESTQVVCEGEATKKNGDKVKFNVPVKLVKIQYELQKKFNHEYNFEANQFVELEWAFDFAETVTMTEGETSAEE